MAKEIRLTKQEELDLGYKIQAMRELKEEKSPIIVGDNIF